MQEAVFNYWNSLGPQKDGIWDNRGLERKKVRQEILKDL